MKTDTCKHNNPNTSKTHNDIYIYKQNKIQKHENNNTDPTQNNTLYIHTPKTNTVNQQIKPKQNKSETTSKHKTTNNKHNDK